MLTKAIYQIFIYIYVAAAQFAALFNNKAAKWVAGRKNLWNQIDSALPGMATKKRVWVHCASLGEFEQGRPVIEAIKQQYPDVLILLTFFSPSGFEVRKNYPFADAVWYLPADTPGNARRFVETVNPGLVIFVKYEFWFNYLQLLQKNKIPIFLISAVFRPGQFFFRWYGSGFRKMLETYRMIYVQNIKSEQLLQHAKGLQVKTAVAPDTRFDRVQAAALEAKTVITVEQFAAGRQLFICGSTWPQDEQLLARFIQQAPHEVAFVIAPHKIGKMQLSGLVKTLEGTGSILYSEAIGQPDFADVASKYRVLIVDNIGLLLHIYRYGSYAYIGGGFGAGIHNILEAAVFGLPLFFGPRYSKFNEAVYLIGAGGAFSVGSTKELLQQFTRLYDNRTAYLQAASICKSYVEQNAGGTRIILEGLRPYLTPTETAEKQ
ncbi:3-deoxy-D-manno-octulosonic acid transferase [Sphingobacteriales bacterium UPWRP_1]|nr:3-deoxy-D-manno-octulosonic acid transferase [Sphingobacteriales bacterium UPWRP_1]